MGREIVYCSLCGERISPDDVEKGAALRSAPVRREGDNLVLDYQAGVFAYRLR